MSAPTDWVPIQNGTEQLIPSGGLMRVVGIDQATGALIVDLPDRDGDPSVCVNGLAVIPAGGTGHGHFDTRAIVAYDQADGTPLPGESWGSAAGSWFARKGRAGMTILAGAGLGMVNVTRLVAEAAIVLPTGPPDPISGLHSGQRLTLDPETGEWVSQQPIWIVDVGGGGSGGGFTGTLGGD